ncbi:dihydrolipoamide acetyltransferase family protein [Kutzneria sp. NPDC052558]|uniref:dihydrolipoamide acetyltransferase family protein n=1 Tax=Kutzneria sp. NPDC052558 TaxID=3364121 RepID=UPI0037C8D647
MSQPRQFLLPDVGEGLTEAEVLRWSVKPGDEVEVNQILVEIETAKAAVELPSPYAGVVAALHIAEGETAAVGTPLITIDTGEPAAVGTPPTTDDTDEPAALLVGYGPPAEDAPSIVDNRPPAVVDNRPLAKPPVRKLAKDLGVDLTRLSPTGPHGTISRADVQAAAAPPASTSSTSSSSSSSSSSSETRIPIRGVRKHMAAAMVASAFTAPHVTEFLTVDVTQTLALLDTIRARREFRDVKVTPLAIVARALTLALRATPEANATWDEAAQEIVVKRQVNLGIAAATDRGLVVPVIRDAEQLSLRELAEAITRLAADARAGRTAPSAMTGGTVTITNVGVFGVDTGTPILNPGETAILAVGAIRRMPWVVTGPDGVEHIEPRSIAQLALSFDHRVLDGAQGSRLLADVGDVLRTPGLALL